MNWKRGFKRIIHVLAIVIAVACGIVASFWSYEEVYANARTLDILYPKGIAEEDTEKAKESITEMTVKNDMNMVDFVDMMMKDKEELGHPGRLVYKNLEPPRSELIGMVVLFGLLGTVVGWIGTWVILWYGGLIVFMCLRWLALGFREDNSINEQKNKQINNC